MAIRERWFADSFEFTDGDIRDVEYRSGQLGIPAARGSNGTVAQRTGELWRPKVHEAGDFTLEVWFGTYQRQAQAMWDSITKAIVQPHRLVTWRRITASGEIRYCEGEVTAALEPVAIGQNAYRASLEVHVPRGYWRGDTEFTFTTSTLGEPATDAAGRKYRDLTLDQLAPSTAALEELVLRVDGQASNPRIVDLTDRGRGEELLYAVNLPADRAIALDCATWETTGHGGHVVVEEAVNYTGERFFTVAAPPPDVIPRLRLVADALGAGAKLTVSGYRSYLC